MLIDYLPERSGIMSQNKAETPEAKEAMNKLKEETASELGIDLNDENLSAQDAGKVGGQMTKKLVEQAEKNM